MCRGTRWGDFCRFGRQRPPWGALAAAGRPSGRADRGGRAANDEQSDSVAERGTERGTDGRARASADIKPDSDADARADPGTHAFADGRSNSQPNPRTELDAGANTETDGVAHARTNAGLRGRHVPRR